MPSTGYPSSYRPRGRAPRAAPPTPTPERRLAAGPEAQYRRTSEQWGQTPPAQSLQKVDPIGKALGFWGKKPKQPPDYLYNDQTGGYESLLQGFEGGASTADALQDLLANFKGNPEQFADFMEIAGPLMGALESRRLEGSQGLAYMSDQGNWDLGAMGAYGAAAGQIGRGTREAMRSGEQSMAAQGLGRGTARTAASEMLRQSGSNQQADLRSQLEQTAARNRMGSANQLFDAHRTIAQLALGQQITPRITSPQDTQPGVGPAQGALAGAGAGAAFGPWGAGIGALAGAGLGAYQQSRSR